MRWSELEHRNLPVRRFEGVHGVVVHGVEFLLPNPVENVDRQHLEQDMDKPGVVLHVHWKAVIRNLTDDPGTTPSTHVHLHNRHVRQTSTYGNYLQSARKVIF